MNLANYGDPRKITDTVINSINVSHHASFKVGYNGLTMADIRALAENKSIPDNAIVSVRKDPGDQREQGSGYTEVTIKWTD